MCCAELWHSVRSAQHVKGLGAISRPAAKNWVHNRIELEARLQRPTNERTNDCWTVASKSEEQQWRDGANLSERLHYKRTNGRCRSDVFFSLLSTCKTGRKNLNSFFKLVSNKRLVARGEGIFIKKKTFRWNFDSEWLWQKKMNTNKMGNSNFG